MPHAEEFNEHGGITRAKAPVSGVSVPAHMGVGTDLVDGIDYVVLLQVLFDVASGMDVTPLKVWERLKERGIRSTKNREELVGKNSVYESFTRIIAAGYLLRVELPNEKHPGRKGRIAYKLYDNPAWNPDWQARQVGSDPLEPSEKQQVRTRPGTRELVDGEVGVSQKTAGQNASRNQGSGNAGSPVPGRGGRRVPAGQNASPVPGRVEPSPPHPPEEVTTSSPNPLTGTSGPGALPSQTEGEEAGYAQEDLQAAADVLQLLPDPWTQGKLNAGKLAPKLLTVMAEQGWPGIHEVDRQVLARQLGKNPHKVTNPYRLLASDRIPNLPRYEVVSAAAKTGSGGPVVEMCPKHPKFRAGNRCIPCCMP
ncbi:hypothetical protein [Streptomyces sp. SP18CM02]|uniref:hypothetical protein n=1 Tax=Streptomyces sp. SP18CM02 TaxID=2758571 RepID=UPI00168B4DD4|nr:hypothetical protein [Streptomyces sp. SP18CM02]MBD3550855.1 hypothetical protein [Streptomyces sp. SP18CM02]